MTKLENMKQKTAIRQLIETNDELRHAMQIIQNFIEGDHRDQASLKEAWNLISGYVTLSESLEPVNEQQIKDAASHGVKTCGMGHVFPDLAERYFNETFEKP